MQATLSERLLAPAGIGATDRESLLRTALRLHRAALDGTLAPLLAGRHVAIASDAGRTPAEDLFERAATRLGARVSRISLDLLRADATPARHAAVRLLPRLYDAVDCEQGQACHALALQRRSGVPVYLALAGAGHPLRALLSELPADDPDAALTSLVQAVLVETLA